MPIEVTHEHAKALYDFANKVQVGKDFVYAVRLLERLAEMGDPYYTPFALSQIAQCYSQLGHRDRATVALARITKLPRDQQRLLHPGRVAYAYQRVGDFRAGRELHSEILELTPHALASVAAIGELCLLEGDPGGAEGPAAELRESPDPGYQVLGRIIGAFALALKGKHEAAEKELSWVGEFLVSSGSVPGGVWDYRDLEPLADKTGSNAKVFGLIFGLLTSKSSFAVFIEAWRGSSAAVQPRLGTG